MSKSNQVGCLPSMGRGTARSVVEGGGPDARLLDGGDATIAPSTACGGPLPRSGEDFGADPIFTPALKVRFLDLLSQHGNVRVAAARVGVSRSGLYLARRRDTAFANAWRAALVEARWHVEAVLAERALEGVEEQVFYHGEVIATRRRYDTRLLLAHLGRLDALCELPLARSEPFDHALAKVAGVAPAGLPGERAARMAAAEREATAKFDTETRAEEARERERCQTTMPADEEPDDDLADLTPAERAAVLRERREEEAYQAELAFEAELAARIAAGVAAEAAAFDSDVAAMFAAIDALRGERPEPLAIEVKSLPGRGRKLRFMDSVHCVHRARAAGGLAALRGAV